MNNGYNGVVSFWEFTVHVLRGSNQDIFRHFQTRGES